MSDSEGQIKRPARRRGCTASASLLLSVVSLLGCVSSEAPDPAPSPHTVQPCLCFDGIGSSKGEAPVLELVVEGEPRAIVCGYTEAPAQARRALVSEFDVFDCASGESLAMYGATDRCEVAVRSDELHITELARLPAGEDWAWQQVPLIRRSVTAAGSSLALSAPEVVFEAPALSPERIAAFTTELATLKATRVVQIEEWELIFGKLLVCALTGDQTCIAILEDPVSRLDIELDGAVAEAHRQALRRFQSIGGD